MTNTIRSIPSKSDMFQRDPVLRGLFKDFDKIFDWSNLPLAGDTNHPLVNISTLYEVENGKQYTMEFALAGYKRDEIESYVEQLPINGTTCKVLTVTVTPSQAEKGEYITKEISKRKASRNVIIGNSDVIEDASYEDGILYVTVFRENKQSEQRQQINIS